MGFHTVYYEGTGTGVREGLSEEVTLELVSEDE